MGTVIHYTRPYQNLVIITAKGIGTGYFFIREYIDSHCIRTHESGILKLSGSSIIAIKSNRRIGINRSRTVIPDRNRYGSGRTACDGDRHIRNHCIRLSDNRDIKITFFYYRLLNPGSVIGSDRFTVFV